MAQPRTTGGGIQPHWDTLLDARADADTAPPVEQATFKVGREATDPDTGWALHGYTARRPGKGTYDWLVTLTRPDGHTAAVAGDHGAARFTQAEATDWLPGLGSLLDAPSHRPNPKTSAYSYQAWWAHAAGLHAALSDPDAWLGHPVRRVPADDPDALNGVDDLTVLLRWASYGVPDLATAQEWRRLGLTTVWRTVPGLMDWVDHGFTPQTARLWMGVCDGASARRWADAGETPEHAAAWRTVFTGDLPLLPPADIGRLEAAGWTPALLHQMIAACGQSAEHTGPFFVVGHYLGPVAWGPRPTEPLRPLHRMRPERLIAYRRAGVTDRDEIDTFETSATPPTDAELATMAALSGPSTPHLTGLVPV